MVMFGIVTLIVILLLIILFVSIINNLKQLEVKVEEAMSGIDVALTKRFDLLTKSIDTVKGYVKHEESTLKSIVEMRNPGNKVSMEQKQEFSNKVTEACGKINLLVENYPQLKADTQFTMLQQGIADTEEHLQASRRLFNANVSKLNQEIVTFPKSVIAKMIGMTKKDFFEVEENKKQDVKISF